MNILGTDLNEEHFSLRKDTFLGRKAILINPRYSDDGWTNSNLRFRSVIVDESTGDVLCQGFPKFFNFGQSPELYEGPFNHDDWYLSEKIDGSLTCVTSVDGNLSVRTRGSFNALSHSTSHEFYKIFEIYPKLKTLALLNPDKTFLFEYCSPNYVIVINHQALSFYFLGIIDKQTGRLEDYPSIQDVAIKNDFIYTPLYNTSHVHARDLNGIVSEIKVRRGSEGVVLSYNNGQNRVKIKSDEYLHLHRIVSGFSSVSNVVDLFLDMGAPSEEDFMLALKRKTDYEFSVSVKSIVSGVCIKYKNLMEKIEEVASFVKNSNFSTRKEFAIAVNAKYKPPYNGMAFTLMDKKKIENLTIKKVLNE